ncbi:anti sigma factor C-terminal domain-containing protein [Peribacillus sp. NPDC097295]|uniref:anti sigma factor C-terminal domain-containing protein n=1 Tax=Peribacillus sp. NPDC097295 TaxID=3364402 RepID=UPI0037FE6350
MKEDHEIDHFFDSTFNDKDLIKSVKRKSYFRITGVSFLVSICVLILLVLLKIQLTPYLVNQKMVAKELYYEIYGANIYTGTWSEQYKLVGSSATAPKYKLLNGKLVNIGEVSLDTSNLEITVGNSEYEQYTYAGNRVMNFFHPSLQYQEYAKDLNELNKVNDGKWIEMALSFDRAYTYKEVVSMLPHDVSLQWNWVNSYSTGELDELKEPSLTESGNLLPLKEHEVAGFPTISKTGEQIKNPIDSFISSLDLALSKGGTYKKEFEHLHNVLKKDQASLTNKNVEIIGVVVVGDKQQLQALRDKKYIKASSFGTIVDRY